MSTIPLAPPGVGMISPAMPFVAPDGTPMPMSFRFLFELWKAVGASGAGVTSFNTRTGAVVLSYGDVTGALAFTPYNATNPSGYQTAANITTALAAGQPGAFSTLSASGAFTPSVGIVGTVAGTNAAAGRVGEYLSAVVAQPGSAILTATWNNIVSLALTAGDWDVWGTIGFQGAGTTTASAYYGSLSSVSGSPNPSPGTGAAMQIAGSFGAGLTNQCFPVGTIRISNGAASTVYLIGQAQFAVSTMQAYGFIGARRVR